MKLISDITNTIRDNRNKFDAHCIIGDLNTDFDRISSAHVTTVNNFIFEEQLSRLWNNYNVDFTFSQNNSVSTIDHFLLSNK